MITEIEPVIIKIKKLFALSTSSNENEAQAALLKAQELLAKYKLSMRDVNGHTMPSKDVSKKFTDITFKKATWKGLLASLIADNFSVYVYYYTRGSNRVVFYGLKEDTETAAEVFEYAVEFITGKVRQLRQRYYRLGQSAKGLENDYAQGFIVGLKQKFDQQKRENQEWALVLVKPQIVIDSYQEFEKSFKRSVDVGQKFLGHSSAWQRGVEDGRNFVMIAGRLGK